MRLGLQIPRFGWPGGSEGIGPKLTQIARAADDAGFTSIWVMDHFFQIDRPQMGMRATDPMLDGYTALSYIASVTRRARLGTMVTGVIYRHPGHLIKIVSNLDVLSGGRATLGIGAAWYEREAVGLGFPFPPLKERFERLEEVLQIAKHVWSGSAAPFEGKHYRLAEPINSPAPLTAPHPPILIGGMGERKTLRLVAQYADACNLFAFGGPQLLTHKLDVLKRHCDAVGRSYEAIERTTLSTIRLGSGGMSASQVVAHCEELSRVGIQHAIFNMPNDYEIAPIETIGRDVIPAVAGL